VKAEIIGLRLLSLPKVLTQHGLMCGLKHSAKSFVLDICHSKTWPHSLCSVH